MSGDFAIIKNLENYIGCRIPMSDINWKISRNGNAIGDIGYKDMVSSQCIGAFIDGNNVRGLALAPDDNSLNLKNLPNLLFSLKNLESINISYNKIEHVSPEFKKLEKLKRLSLSNNQIREIDLSVLDLDLPIIVDGNRCGYKGLILSNNPIDTPPLDIIREGREAIVDFFSQVEKEFGESELLFEAKLMVIGDGGTGKTTFKRKIIDSNAEMPQEGDTTLGIDVDKWSYQTVFPERSELGEIQFNVNIWDFGGQKIYRGTHQMFFIEKSYYVLVAETREQNTDFFYWLNTVKQLAGKDSSVLIVLNKKFGHDFKFDDKGYKRFFGEIINDVLKIDLSTDRKKLAKLRDIVQQQLKGLPNIGDRLPPSWVEIRKKLAREKKDYITFDRFKDICSCHSIDDASTIHTLSKYFTRVGVFTHYIDDLFLSERIYLNSNWLIKTVYEVLDNPEIKKKNGRINHKNIEKIWKSSEFKLETKRLIGLMNKFGLMYQVIKTDNYIVPEHLPIIQPYDEWKYITEDNLLHFIYEFTTYMPEGLMSQLIVSLHRYIVDHSKVWHRGFNIESDNTQAEIIVPHDKGNTIHIRIAGSEKQELLAVIREHFTTIIKPFRDLEYSQLIPCICDECRSSEQPSFHNYRALIRLREKVGTSQCPESGLLVNIEHLLRITKFVEDYNEHEVANIQELKNIRLFLASSVELHEDRKQIEIFISRENRKFVKKRVFLELVIWENFIDAISETRLQDEYNKAILGCDIFIGLFGTKVGKYTKEEFHVAYGAFKEKKRPKFIYTYFKEMSIKTTKINIDELKSLVEFKRMLVDEVEHYPTYYDSIASLEFQIKDQLEKVLAQLVQ